MKEQIKKYAKQFWYWLDGESTGMKLFVGFSVALLILWTFCD